MYNVEKQIENLDNMCIPPNEKEKRIQELKQLNHSIAYSSTILHFSWNIDTITSYKRDRRYTIEDMLCKLTWFFHENFMLKLIHFVHISIIYFSPFWRNDGLCDRNVCCICLRIDILDNTETNYKITDKQKCYNT